MGVKTDVTSLVGTRYTYSALTFSANISTDKRCLEMNFITFVKRGCGLNDAPCRFSY